MKIHEQREEDPMIFFVTFEIFVAWWLSSAWRKRPIA